jgi:hypothetical protein
MICARLLIFSTLLALFPVLAQADEIHIELGIIVDGVDLRGISYSAASGPFVAGVGIIARNGSGTNIGVATGAIASIHPVHPDYPDNYEGDSFELYSSPVGQ